MARRYITTVPATCPSMENPPDIPLTRQCVINKKLPKIETRLHIKELVASGVAAIVGVGKFATGNPQLATLTASGEVAGALKANGVTTIQQLTASGSAGLFVPVALSDFTAYVVATSVAQPHFWLQIDGGLEYTIGTISTIQDVSGEWYDPEPTTGIGTNYDVMIDQKSFGGGATFLGWREGGTVTDTWVNIGNSADFYANLTRTIGNGAGTSSCDFRLRIRDAATLEVLATAQCRLEATIS